MTDDNGRLPEYVDLNRRYERAITDHATKCSDPKTGDEKEVSRHG